MLNYSLDELIKIFSEHAEINDAQMKKNRENYPDQEWTKNDFNISKALLNICAEIKKLK